jgi:hypothetical protein
VSGQLLTPAKRPVLIGLAVGLVLVACASIVGAFFLLIGGNGPKEHEEGAATVHRPDAAGRQALAVQKPTGKPVASTPELTVHLPPAKQQEVNRAVAAACRYLLDSQLPDGRWPSMHSLNEKHRVGMAALPGLTLLECHVRGDNPAIQTAAKYIRARCPRLAQTYDLCLAILFLDRLNEPRDQALIRTLALRLVSGQTNNGGWSYRCPLLKPGEENLLLGVLKDFPLTNKLELLAAPRDGKKGGENKLHPQKPPEGEDGDPEGTKLVLDADQIPRSKLEQITELPPRLRRLPVLQVNNNSAGRGAPQRSDNSNTQFAILALWAARRHHLPLDRTLGLIVKRFRTSQLGTGGWQYNYAYTVGAKNNRPGKATMTCAGLLGLAVGHGLARELKLGGADVPDKDPAVEQALKALASGITRRRPSFWVKVRRTLNAARHPGRVGWPIYDERFNLYLLWSVERVGVIFRLREIGPVDWYAWGTDILLDNQAKAGSWHGQGYAGSAPIVDTCLALLFLRQVNLAQDLTDKLILRTGEGR